jgi:hypothetical protein
VNAASATDSQILRYQNGRGLDNVSAYSAGLQLRLRDGRRVYLALSQTELALYFDSGPVLHYDLEGRLTKISEHDHYRRRGLSHRVLLTRKRTPEEGGGLERVMATADACDMLVAQANALTVEVHDEFRAGATITEFAKPSYEVAPTLISEPLKKSARFGVPEALESAEKFHTIYGRVAVLPPDQYNALLVQATEGCAYSGCLFCELYRGEFYGQKTPARFREHLNAAVTFHGEGLRARRSIFLGEANALALPQSTLLEFFHILNEQFKFPKSEQEHVPANWWLGSKTRFDGVSSFLDAFSGVQRTVAEFAALHELGLRRVYIGMETGSNALLRWLCKPATAEKIHRSVVALKEANIAVGVIVLLGAGGRQFDMAHTQATVELLNDLQLSAGDYIYFSPLVIYRGSRYDEQTEALGIEPLTSQEIDDQERHIRSALRVDARRGRPYIARYQLETFLY